MIPSIWLPITVPSSRIALSILLFNLFWLAKKSNWKSPSSTDSILLFIQSHVSFVTRASDTIPRLLFLQWTVSPKDTCTRPFTSAYSSVSSIVTISTDIVIFGLSSPASHCSSHRFFSAASSCACVSHTITPFDSSFSCASARIFTFSKLSTPYFTVGYLSISGESTQGLFPSIWYPL